jgi:hypothetical protein
MAKVDGGKEGIIIPQKQRQQERKKGSKKQIKRQGDGEGYISP